MYRRLRANQDGIVSATQATQLVAPAEGEALITADGASVRDAARAAELDETVMARGAMQTVRPTECPPCPEPSVIYKDRVVEKPVYIYRSAPPRALPVEELPGAPMAPGFPAEAGGGVGPYLPASGETPEPADAFPADAATGLPVVRKTGNGFPWWLLALGAGVAWMALRKR